MEVITVNLSKPSDLYSNPITSHKDLVRYPQADHNLQEAARHIENVHGFLDGKAVVVEYKEE